MITQLGLSEGGYVIAATQRLVLLRIQLSDWKVPLPICGATSLANLDLED
jgi:hypothetical protein